MNSLFKKVESGDVDQLFRISIVFKDNSFNLLILEKANAWKTEVSWNEIMKLADQFELSAEEYYSTLKQYLENTPVNVDLKIKNKEFICYRKENNINLKYFSCKLKKAGFNECVYDLLDDISSKNQILEQQNTENKKERDKSTKDCKQLEEKLTELVERKMRDEEELLSNFVLVLNEKKRVIQHLNQTLHAFKAGRPVLNPEIKLKKSAKTEIKKETSEVSESSSSDEEYNTDEEKSKDNEESPRNVVASTSKSRADEFLNDSTDLIALPKRRKIKNGEEKYVSDTETPSTSKVQSKTEELQPVVDVEMKENSPNVSFDTQDLLDCI